jgi:capsule polysaccharide export protein KpsE/RkpR
MAIIVEEEKKKSHIFSLVGWLTFLVIAAVAVYYIFFASPQTVTLSSSASGLSAIAPLTQSAVQPQTVENSAALQALKTTIATPTSTGPVSVTRQNPFIAP